MCKRDEFITELKCIAQQISDEGLNVYDDPFNILIIRYKELKRQQKLF